MDMERAFFFCELGSGGLPLLAFFSYSSNKDIV
jgi:hypothetical protein